MNFALNSLAVFLLALISPVLVFFGLVQLIWERIAFWRYIAIDKKRMAHFQQHVDLAYFGIQSLEGVVHFLPDMASNDKYLKKYEKHILMAYRIAVAVRDNYDSNRHERGPILVFGSRSDIYLKSEFLSQIRMLDVEDFKERRDAFLESLDVKEALNLVDALVSYSLDRARNDRILDEGLIAKAASLQISR